MSPAGTVMLSSSKHAIAYSMYRQTEVARRAWSCFDRLSMTDYSSFGRFGVTDYSSFGAFGMTEYNSFESPPRFHTLPVLLLVASVG